MIKAKKFISFVFAFSSILTLSSCNLNNTTNVTQNKNEIPFKDNTKNEFDLQWDYFVNQNEIKSILDFVFQNKPQKRLAFINEQKKLVGNKTYRDEVKSAFLYANNIVNSLQKIPFSNWPYIRKNGSDTIVTLLNKNWLFFLYNFNKFKFAYSPFFDQFSSTLENTAIETYENTKKLSAFLNPKSNKFVQYTFQDPTSVSTNDYYTYRNFFLLNSQGLIIQLNLQKISSDPNADWEVSIKSYLNTYPRIFESPQLNDIFSLWNYVNLSQSFDGQRDRRSDKVIYDDFYGGKPLQFTLYDLD